MTAEHIGTRFDRLPKTERERAGGDRPTQASVLTYFADRFGIDPSTFEGYSFWERGRGNIWAFSGHPPTPLAVEALGIHVLRTNQRDWKPTTDGMQRFGRDAEDHVIALSRQQAIRFWRGDTLSIPDATLRGYVVVTQPIAGRREPLGVGLAIRGDLRSQVPKGRRRDLEDR